MKLPYANPNQTFSFASAYRIILENGIMGIFSLPYFLIYLFGPISIILWYRWKIIIKDNQITFTPYIGKTKTLTFNDITKIKRGIVVVRGYGHKEYIEAYHETEKLFYIISISPSRIAIFN